MLEFVLSCCFQSPENRNFGHYAVWFRDTGDYMIKKVNGLEVQELGSKLQMPSRPFRE